MNIFEIAARKKLRFASSRGELTTEQLFDLSLNELDIIGQPIVADLRSASTESLIPTKPNPRQPELEIKLEIVKHVIAVKVKERDEAVAAQERADKRRKLLEAIAKKDDEALTTASKEDLLKQLAELDG
ncbi:hypothetical protein IB276_33285 [Ensifer sp. ENS04]|uniref:hypothetical protein n=1 Tax=Ensifer sp. ENS04 TaxID=2769281 RepID=UPI00177D6DF4|nr:hypothetical protein [Ensifer sp. ENS04]MBD9544322.1 hypothetical protein [Ensifer sp. ENS04]